MGEGRRVALEHVPAPGDDAAAELAVLIGEVHAAGLAAECELTVPVDRLGLAPTAAAAGLAVASTVELPGDDDVVPAGEPGAEERCRALGPAACA